MPSYKKGKKQSKKPASRKIKKGGSFCKMVGCADKEEPVSPENEDISDSLEEDKEVSPSPEEDEEVSPSPEEDKEVSPSPEEDEEVSPSPEEDEEDDEDDMDIEKESITGGKRKTRKSKPKSKKGGKTMKKLTEWTKLVSEIFKKNRAKNSTYMFKQALKEAKKIYKKK